ncbi:MAG: hypothetical protein ACR2QW_17195 [bacterium]
MYTNCSTPRFFNLLPKVRVFIIALMIVPFSAQVQASGHELLSEDVTARDPALDNSCLPSSNTTAGGPVVRMADLKGEVSLSFDVSIDLDNPAFFRPVNVAEDDVDFGLHEQQPQFGIAKISSPADGFGLDVAIKRPSQRKDLLWVEWFVINDSKAGLKDVDFEVSDLDAAYVIYDLAADVWAGPVDQNSLLLGGVAPQGVTKLVMGIGSRDGSDLNDQLMSRLDFKVTLRGAATRFAATNSLPIAVSSDGTEVWAPFADANLIAVIDADRKEKVAKVRVEGAPEGIAITPDGKYVVVAAPLCNQIVIIDRQKRQVVQRFGESEGVGREPREAVLSPDGSRVYVSSYVGDSITVLEYRQDGFSQAGTISVGRRPTRISVSPDGKAIYVAHFLPRGQMADNEVWISVYDTEQLSLLTEASVVDSGNPEQMSCMRKLRFYARWEPEQLQMEAPFTSLQGAFLNLSGTEVVVPTTLVVPFLVFEGDMEKAGINRPQGRITTSNILSFDTRRPARTHVRQLDTLLEIRDQNQEFQRCANRHANVEFPNAYLGGPDRPDILTSNGATLPTGETALFQTGQIRSLTHSLGGRRTIYVSYTSDELAVLDDATHHSVAQRHLVLSGNNPLGIALTPDGKTGFVLYDNSPYVSVIDTSAYALADALPRPAYVPFWLSRDRHPQSSASTITTTRVTRDISAVPFDLPISEVGKIALVDEDPVDPAIRRGKILFSSANPDKYPELSAHREGSCSNCHPRGGTDGSMWVTIEGERRTLNLRGGVGGRGWLHASATHHDAHEFVSVVTKERLGGTGLSAADLDAMARYLAWEIPRLQAPVTDPALVAQGQALFAEHCDGCHLSAFDELARQATDNKPYGGANDEPDLHDVGTFTSYAGAAMGEAFQALFAADPVRGPILQGVVGDRALEKDDVVFEYLQSSPRPARPEGEFKAGSLVNVWDNALFFHNGQFSDLRDVVEYMIEENELPLADEQIDALVEYLRTF